MKRKYILLSVLIAFAVGFFLGRATLETTDKVREIKGKTVNGAIYTSAFKLGKEFTEFKTKLTDLPLIFWKRDTVIVNNIKYVNAIPDTIKIVEDFMTKRDYSFNVFDDSNGKLDVTQTVQFNKLQNFDYSFTPIHREITRTRGKLFTPYISVSYSSLSYIGIGGGVFIKDLGVEYNYLYNTFDKNGGHFLGIKYKF